MFNYHVYFLFLPANAHIENLFIIEFIFINFTEKLLRLSYCSYILQRGKLILTKLKTGLAVCTSFWMSPQSSGPAVCMPASLGTRK